MNSFKAMKFIDEMVAKEIAGDEKLMQAQKIVQEHIRKVSARSEPTDKRSQLKKACEDMQQSFAREFGVSFNDVTRAWFSALGSIKTTDESINGTIRDIRNMDLAVKQEWEEIEQNLPVVVEGLRKFYASIFCENSFYSDGAPLKKSKVIEMRQFFFANAKGTKSALTEFWMHQMIDLSYSSSMLVSKVASALNSGFYGGGEQEWFTLINKGYTAEQIITMRNTIAEYAVYATQAGTTIAELVPALRKAGVDMKTLEELDPQFNQATKSVTAF